MAIIAPCKRNAAILQVDEPVVGYGDSVGVTGKVVQDLLGTREGRLGVHHPIGLATRSQEFFKRRRIVEMCSRAVKPDSSLDKIPSETVEQQPAK